MSEVLEFPAAPASSARRDSAAQTATVAIVGLGYVGLPLAVAFGKERPTV
jgi:UDP-N-acetyl-D-mannosaminuronate dehydrogenase